MVSRADDFNGDSGFLAIPSISLRRSKIVIAHKGEYEKLKVRGTPVKPLKLVEGLFEHFEAIHVLDLDGLLKGSPDIGFIRQASDKGDIWVDPGARVADPLIDMVMAGAAQTVISSKTIQGLRELVNAYEMSEDVVFEIDFDDGRVMAPSDAMSGLGPDGVIEEVKDMGIWRFILADYSRLEGGKGPDLGLLQDLVHRHKDIELYAAVGVRPRHLPELEEIGLAGAILDLRSVLDELSLDL